jgi:hypothetical protein
MANTRGLARLGILAVGLGIGAAVAHSPVASADSSSDWLSSIDSLLGGSALPAPSSGLDLAISFDGMSLVHDGSATANTTSGEYGLAIAEGANSYASATGGTGDYALADGTNGYAVAGGESSDTGANYDSAIDIGNNELPTTNYADGAYSGNGDLDGSTGTGSYDTAIDIGNNTNDAALGVGGSEGADAGAGGLFGQPGDGDHDTAIDIGDNSGVNNGAMAVAGDGNYASESGSTVGEYDDAFAGIGNDNTVVDDASYSTNFGDGYADYGNNNYVSILGPEGSNATADEGNSNIAYVFDPFGSTASEATSGNGNSDLAAVLLTDGPATATYANDMYDIVTAAGSETGTAAATSGGWLADLLSLF